MKLGCHKNNGNCGAQQKISVSTNISEEIVPLQQEFPIFMSVM